MLEGKSVSFISFISSRLLFFSVLVPSLVGDAEDTDDVEDVEEDDADDDVEEEDDDGNVELDNSDDLDDLGSRDERLTFLLGI